MVEIHPDRLDAILNNGRNRRILVVGDLMIDRYLWGEVGRISPEAPVPIININDEEVRFGGAANVANNIIGLNAEPVLVGTVGDDAWGDIFRKRLADKNLTGEGLISDPSRPTTIKTRIIGNNQQIARVDREKTQSIGPEIQEKTLQYVASVIGSIDAVLLQDYNKGMLIPELVDSIIALANQHNKIITVDPKFDNFLEFRNVTVFKPNKKETEEALAMRMETEADIERAGAALLEKLNAKSVLITLGERGMALIEKEGRCSFEETRARKVADVSGAGDTVIATLTTALAAGAELREAVTLSNFAAGVVCEEVGVVPIDTKRLAQTVIKG